MFEQQKISSFADINIRRQHFADKCSLKVQTEVAQKYCDDTVQEHLKAEILKSFTVRSILINHTGKQRKFEY